MTKCEKCIHGDICANRDRMDADDEIAMTYCAYFIGKTDFAEVVRCRDCKYSYFAKSCSKYECRKGCGALKYSTDFCSYGERKGD